VAGRPDEVGGDEPVQRPGHALRVGGRGDRGEVGVERIAGDGGAVDQRARVIRERGDLQPDRGHQRRRERLRRVARDAAQLLQEQRVAARLLHDALAQRRVGDRGDELARRVVGQRARLEVGEAGRAAGGVEQAGGGILRAERERQQMRSARRAAQQVQDELDRRLVGPVQVVEQQRDRPLAAEQLEQRAHGAVVAEALGGARRRELRRLGVRERRGGQDRRQIGADRLDAARVERRDVVVERVDGEAERDRALVLGRPPFEHEHAGPGRALAHRGHQRALADARLPEHAERASRARRRLLDGCVRRGELRLAS
jgi:hypothetical protein